MPSPETWNRRKPGGFLVVDGRKPIMPCSDPSTTGACDWTNNHTVPLQVQRGLAQARRGLRSQQPTYPFGPEPVARVEARLVNPPPRASAWNRLDDGSRYLRRTMLCLGKRSTMVLLWS